MNATAEAPKPGSKIKDLVVTAAVASVVSALVAPWIRRWIDPPPPVRPMVPPSNGPPPAVVPVDDYEQRLERLLDVPDTASGDIVAPFRSPTKKRDADVEDEQ